ncbi:cytochrome P450 [Streptosporangium sp. NPDC051022]|uniref:cytochrome P450 family protein n=1 Tax=Streptosporangium sp. NPDC051022 TaxID=3155752 RepID=UPI0034300124
MENLCPVVIDRTGRDIHEEAARMRAQGPVARIELPGGVLAWSITGYDAVMRALADHRLSKDPRKHWTAFAAGEIGHDFPLIGWALMENLSTAYGSDHSRLRRLIAKAFTPRRVEAMRSGVEKIAADLLDELAAAAPDEVVDLKARYAHPLAARVIGDLIGVPERARAGVLPGSDAHVDTTRTAEDLAADAERRRREMRELIEAKRRAPADDLTTDLISAQDNGSQLNDTELLSTLLLLLGTGTEPVTNLVTNTVRALLIHPGQRELLAAGHVSWEEVIEETLRAEAPVAHLPFRFAVEDIEIGGVTIRKGEPVLIAFAAAGRDPAVHGASADRFDATRADKAHLSFGHGIYRCIGMPLGWMETEIALRALFDRFPGLTLGVPPEEIEGQGTFIMNGCRTLPVRLNGRDRARQRV